MVDWIIKKEDIIHWFRIPQQLCGSPATTIFLHNDDGPADFCGSPLPSLAKQNKNSNAFDDNAAYNNRQIEQFMLQELRSNRSMVDGRSSSRLNSAWRGDDRTDQKSIGSETLPDSDDEDERKGGLMIKNNRCSTRFLICVAVTFFLIMFAIGVGLSIMVNKRNAPESSNGSSSSSSSSATTSNANSLSDSLSSNPQQPEEIINSNVVSSNDRENEDSSSYGNDGNKYDYTSNTDYLVGAYYYPWHGENFHNGGGYLRQDLIPPQQPALGEYNDSNKQVIAQHMVWFRQSNIGLLVTSWWGPNKTEDKNTKNVIMEHDDIGNLKIALHYETTGRIKDNSDMSVPRSDIQYMWENYFDHPNYYKINGRPVLFVYVTRVLHRDGVLEEALLTMRSEASKCGHNLYLIGDQIFQSAPDPDDVFVPFWYFDAVTNYDVYGSSHRPDGYAGKEAVDMYYSEQEKWREQAFKENCRYIPPVSPGYNDRSVRLENDHPPLSRRLTAESEEGSLFWYQLKKALPLVDPLVNNMILVNSFNEWHEDTQIEPAVSVGFAPTTTKPELLTGGLEYVGYGELYLDILGAATSKYKNTNIFVHLYNDDGN